MTEQLTARHVAGWRGLLLAPAMVAMLGLCVISARIPEAHGQTAAAVAWPGVTTAVPAAHCGPGSTPETGIQGRVSLHDRDDGRSRQGYRCNLALVGRYQGQGASWVSAQYKHCVYMSSAFPSTLLAKHPGVTVVDVSNPRHPRRTATLSSPAMLGGTWESLKVNTKRGLLAAVGGGVLVSAGTFDVYSIKKNCAHPVLLNSLASTELTAPANGLGHEGGWAPDGRTYYSAGLLAGSLTAIDVSDPHHPSIIWTGTTNVVNHGFGISANGDRLYLASIVPAGIDTFDISSIQHRRPQLFLREISSVTWPLTDGFATQHAIPFTEHGTPYLLAVDEAGEGGLHLINLSDPSHPVVTRQIRLQIQLPQYAAERNQDADGDGLFGYEAHYCALNRPVNPTLAACGFFDSGIRVFDISDLNAPRQVAYYNPPAQTGKNLELPDSEHAMGLVAQGPDVLDFTNFSPEILRSYLQHLASGDELNNLTTDWCASPPSFVHNQLWVTCMDNGFMVLKFTNSQLRQEAGNQSVIGS